MKPGHIKTFKRSSYIFSAILILLISYKLISNFRHSRAIVPVKTISGKVEDDDLDIVYGYDSAPLTIYMFSSYECKFCNKFFIKVFPRFKKNFIDNGKVKFVVKLVNLSRNADVFYALQAAVCVNRYGKFEKFHELLISDNKVIFSHEFKDLVNDLMTANSGIAECILNNNNYHYIYGNNREFLRLGLKGTPVFVIGKNAYHGYRNYDAFTEIVNEQTDNAGEN